MGKLLSSLLVAGVLLAGCTRGVLMDVIITHRVNCIAVEHSGLFIHGTSDTLIEACQRLMDRVLPDLDPRAPPP